MTPEQMMKYPSTMTVMVSIVGAEKRECFIDDTEALAHIKKILSDMTYKHVWIRVYLLNRMWYNMEIRREHRRAPKIVFDYDAGFYTVANPGLGGMLGHRLLPENIDELPQVFNAIRSDKLYANAKPNRR